MYPDIAKVAISKETMYDIGKDGEVVEVPIPESIKATGIIPEGYSIGEQSCLLCFPCLITMLDYILDPATVVAALANINMTAIESVLRARPLSFSLQIHNPKYDVFRHLSDALFAEMKEIMNAPDNVTIAPSSVVESVSNNSLV